MGARQPNTSKRKPSVDCDEWSRCEKSESLACFCTSRLLTSAYAIILVPLPEWRPKAPQLYCTRMLQLLLRVCTDLSAIPRSGIHRNRKAADIEPWRGVRADHLGCHTLRLARRRLKHPATNFRTLCSETASLSRVFILQLVLQYDLRRSSSFAPKGQPHISPGQSAAALAA